MKLKVVKRFFDDASDVFRIEGEEFEVDEERAKEILNYNKTRKIVEVIEEPKKAEKKDKK